MPTFAKFTIHTPSGDKLLYVNPGLFAEDTPPRSLEGKDGVTAITLKLAPMKHLLVAPFGKLEVSGNPKDIQKEIANPSFPVPENVTIDGFGGMVKAKAADIDFVTKAPHSKTLVVYMADGKIVESEKIRDTEKVARHIEETLATAAQNQHPLLAPIGPLIE